MIRVKSIMAKDVVTVHPDTTLYDASKTIVSKSVSSLLVVDGKKPTALVNENDIIRETLSKGKNPKKIRVRDIMRKNFTVVGPNTKFSYVSELYQKNKVRHFVVVRNGDLAGMVSETDIINATRDFTRFHQIMQEIMLAVFGLVTAFFLFYFSQLGASIFRS